MGYAVDLYDALIGINIPKEKASAVVTAIEHTLSAELATKADVSLLRADIGHLRAEMMQQFSIEREKTDRSLAALEQRMTVRLGGLMATLMGLLFVALQVT
jgi:hypothetical protein